MMAVNRQGTSQGNQNPHYRNPGLSVWKTDRTANEQKALEFTWMEKNGDFCTIIKCTVSYHTKNPNQLSLSDKVSGRDGEHTTFLPLKTTLLRPHT